MIQRVWSNNVVFTKLLVEPIALCNLEQIVTDEKLDYNKTKFKNRTPSELVLAINLYHIKLRRVHLTLKITS